MQTRYGIWIVVIVLVGLVVGCAPVPAAAPAASGGEGAAAAEAAPAASSGESTEGWGGGYEIVPPELCPPVENDEDVEKRVRQPIFQQEFGEEQQDDKVMRVQRGLYANEQGEIFRIAVAGANSAPGEGAIRSYADALRVCLDQILVAGVSEKMAEDKTDTSVPVEGGGESIAQDEPDPEQAAAESLVIAIQSIGFVLEGDVPGEGLQELLQKIVNGEALPPSDWESALRERIPAELSLPFAPTDEWAKETQQDLLVDFIIDPSINNGVRHQYVEYIQQSVSTTVTVGSNSGAGSVRAGLCRDGSASTFTSTTVSRSGTQSARLSGQSDRSRTYDLGVIGRENASKYRMTGRWYRGWDDPAPGGSASDCNP